MSISVEISSVVKIEFMYIFYFMLLYFLVFIPRLHFGQLLHHVSKNCQMIVIHVNGNIMEHDYITGFKTVIVMILINKIAI